MSKTEVVLTSESSEGLPTEFASPTLSPANVRTFQAGMMPACANQTASEPLPRADESDEPLEIPLVPPADSDRFQSDPRSLSRHGSELAAPRTLNVTSEGLSNDRPFRPIETVEPPGLVRPAFQVVAFGLVRLARPRQWIKNLLVFVAPAAAGVLLHWIVLWHGLAAFGIFCLAASGTYFLNDAIDAPSDRLHPTKRLRPVASGAVPVPLAIAGGLSMMIGAVGLGALLAGQDLAVVMALYVGVNLSYSFGLKNEAVLDLAAVSAGFVLRVCRRRGSHKRSALQLVHHCDLLRLATRGLW